MLERGLSRLRRLLKKTDEKEMLEEDMPKAVAVAKGPVLHLRGQGLHGDRRFAVSSFSPPIGGMRIVQ